MRTSTSLACVSLLTLLSACAAQPDGYYDANGSWVTTGGVANPKVAQDHAPMPGGPYNEYNNGHTVYNDGYATAPTAYSTTTTYHYDRAGYYAPDGTYVGADYTSAMVVPVPTDMFPPHGMCRVWFSSRAPNDQPAIESCDGIRARVPAGAYVIYGG
jgi:hypothetical protein